MFLIPSSLNKVKKEEKIYQLIEEIKKANYESQNKKTKNITLFTVLCNKHCFFALMICLIGSFDVTFYEGFISTNLVTKGLDEEYVGFVFAVNSIAYFTCCMLFHQLCGNISRKFFFTFSLFSAGATMFLFGPSILIQLPNNYWLTIVAFLLLGII